MVQCPIRLAPIAATYCADGSCEGKKLVWVMGLIAVVVALGLLAEWWRGRR
jgi:hypothetical protein